MSHIDGSAVVSQLMEKLKGAGKVESGSPSRHLQVWLGWYEKQVPNGGTTLVGLIGKPSLEASEVVTVIEKAYLFNGLDLKLHPNEVLAKAAETKCGSLQASDVQNLAVWVRHHKAMGKLFPIYWKAIGEGKDGANADNFSEVFLKELAAVFGLKTIDLTKAVETDLDVDNVSDALGKEGKKASAEEKKKKRTQSTQKSRYITLGVMGGVLLLLLILLVTSAVKGDLGNSFGGFGEGANAPTTDLFANSQNATDLIQVYDPRQGNGLLPDPVGIYTRQDNGSGQGLFTAVTMYPADQDPTAVLVRNQYYTVALTDIPGVVVVDLGDGRQPFYAPISAFQQTGVSASSIPASDYPAIAALVKKAQNTQTVDAQYKFNWGSPVGLLILGFGALFVFAKFGEARIDGIMGTIRLMLIAGGIGAILTIQSRNTNDSITSALLIFVSLVFVVAASISTKLIKVGRAVDASADAKVSGLMKLLVPYKGDAGWSFLRKLVEFSDWEFPFVAMMVVGMVNANWSPLFALTGVPMGVLFSSVGQIVSATLEMKTRDTDDDDDDDKYLLMMALASAILTPLIVGTRLFSALIPSWFPQMPSIPDVLMVGFVALVIIVFGAMRHGKMPNFSNDDRLMDFMGWVGGFNLTSSALLLVMATMSPIIKIAIIIVVMFALGSLVISVSKAQFFNQQPAESAA